MIKGLSVIVAAVLVLTGCNSGGDDGQAATLEDVKQLAQNIGSGVEIGSATSTMAENAMNATTSKLSRMTFDESCSYGGSMRYSFDETQFYAGSNVDALEVGMEAINCNEEDGVINGEMLFSISEDETLLISFPTNFSLSDGENVMTMYAGGSMKIQEVAPYEVVTLDMRMSDGTTTYAGKNLVYKFKDNSDGTSEMFPVSGEEDFGTGVYFRVDPNYDASKTPMVEDFGGLLAGGMFKYLDGANHAIEIEATALNTLTIRVDENGNGTFESSEIETISLED